MQLDGVDGMTQLRQHGAPEGNRFRVTLETSQIVSNVFKPHEMPTVRHGRPVLIVPGRHARLSNIDKGGFFIEDETFVVKNKTVLRRKGESAGALMKSWRDLRDGDDEEARRWLSRVEVMQQPAAFADGVITCWICEMRLKHEGLITQVCVRDLFAGGLSASIQRMSYMTNQLRTYVAGKMTAVMQLTDTGVAFSLKKIVEAEKEKMRMQKRGEASCMRPFMLEEEGAVTFGTRDLLQIMGESWLKLEEMDHVEQPLRLLAQARAAGWLSWKGDPSTGFLIKCDDEDWMKGREDILPERSHRHPHCWWDLKTGWVNEQGEPKKPNWKKCGTNVLCPEYMTDEFPEQQP